MSDIFKTHASLTVTGTGNNNFLCLKAGEEVDFLSWYRPRKRGPLNIVLKYFNIIYSTGCSQRDKPGGRFTVISASIGYGKKVSKTPEYEVPVLLGTLPSTEVTEGFQSDETELYIPDDYWFSVRFKIRAEEDMELPTTDESASSGYRNGLRTLNVMRPNFIGYRSEFTETLLFFGDSITQGTRTAADKYEAWSHRVGSAMPLSTSVINLGMGWSRAYDAAADGIFLKLAKNGTKIIICFGVNDIKSGGRTGENIIENLQKIIRLLRENNPAVDIILCTVPPFNMEPWQEEQRQKVNKAVLSGQICKKVFDIGSILEEENGRVKPEYMSSSDDAHPNGVGGAAVAEVLLEKLKNGEL
ncbi:MAG: SGNH/GDSL hydrolase family protein [Clostridia bacterium]